MFKRFVYNHLEFDSEVDYADFGFKSFFKISSRQKVFLFFSTIFLLLVLIKPIQILAFQITNTSLWLNLFYGILLVGSMYLILFLNPSMPQAKAAKNVDKKR
ncbi:MAG: hypothetical protein OHK0017_09260 [Patescibacteria group bacterium]